MGAVFVDMDLLYGLGIAVAADVGTLVYHQAALAPLAGLIGENRSEKTGANHKVIIFQVSYRLSKSVRIGLRIIYTINYFIRFREISQYKPVKDRREV